MKVRARVSTDMVGSEVERVLELDDDTFLNEDGTPKTDLIEEEVRGWMFNHIEWGFKVVS